jgi:hypothetical protein
MAELIPEKINSAPLQDFVTAELLFGEVFLGSKSLVESALLLPSSLKVKSKLRTKNPDRTAQGVKTRNLRAKPWICAEKNVL